MQLSPFLWSTSAVCLGLAGCSDDTCGPGDAPVTGLVLSAGADTLTFGNLTWLTGNDCSDPMAPGVISQSLEGTQTDGTGLITICIPRPDKLATPGRTMGAGISTADLRLVDLRGTANNCTFERDTTMPPSGTGVGAGICDGGEDPAGYSLSLDGSVIMKKTCGATPLGNTTMMLTGKVAVHKRP